MWVARFTRTQSSKLGLLRGFASNHGKEHHDSHSQQKTEKPANYDKNYAQHEGKFDGIDAKKGGSLLSKLKSSISPSKTNDSNVEPGPEDDIRQVNVLQSSDAFRRNESTGTFTDFLMNSGLANRISRMLAYQTDSISTERPVANEYNPPKIHENSVFLYQSEVMARKLMRARMMEIPTGVLALLATPHPMIGLSFIGITYFLFLRAKHFEVANRLVVRMDLLPHLEMIAFQKVGLFGQITTKLVKISDLEKYEPEWDKENHFWAFNKQIDRDLVYRDRSTGELFCFDSEGFWDWKGISHKLLY